MLGNSGEDGELGNEIFANVHNGRNISTAVTVVGCRPDGDDRFVLEMILSNISWGEEVDKVEVYVPCNLRSPVDGLWL